jgi:hypothetical protein
MTLRWAKTCKVDGVTFLTRNRRKRVSASRRLSLALKRRRHARLSGVAPEGMARVSKSTVEAVRASRQNRSTACGLAVALRQVLQGEMAARVLGPRGSQRNV